MRNGYSILPFGYEQDNAPGGSADPGQSLRHTKISAHNMKELRG